ncbi:hypothetical protein EMCRGX_G006883, partial [Ephydatia muelleri]
MAVKAKSGKARAKSGKAKSKPIGRILHYGSGADDEVSSDAETTSQPVPATTFQPVPATTSQPVPATTIRLYQTPHLSLYQPPHSSLYQPPLPCICMPSHTNLSHHAHCVHPLEGPHHLAGHCHHHRSHHHTVHLHPCIHLTPMLLKQMEASIVDAIRDLKEALLGKLDEIALSGKPSWPARLPNNLTTPVSRPSPSVDQQASQHTPVPQPPLVPLPSAVLLSPITSGDSLRCLPIREGCNHLPSSDIEKTNLRPPEFTVQCHRNLTTESKIH